MSEVVPDSQQEYWRPPVLTQAVIVSPAANSPIAAGMCTVCQTEFMTGSRFCYLCGSTRTLQSSVVSAESGWNFNFLRFLGFQHIKHGLGLSMASLMGFFAGIGCLVAAVAVGKALTIQTAAEFQALQLLRIEWLLGSVAAFLAGILLKNSGSGD